MTSTEVDVVEPIDEARNAILAALTTKLGGALVGSHIRVGDDLWIRVTADAWADTFRILRDVHHTRFFNWLSAIDWLPSPFGRDMEADVDNIVHGKVTKPADPMVSGFAGGDTRFQVFGRLHNITDRWGITIKADVPDDTLTVPSIISVFAGANWHEREAGEMYGINFAGHPDPRKLYLPTGFEGFPLRKDFPLLARRIKPWPGIVDVEQMPGDDEPEPEAEPGAEG
jgi:NADH-quinone oxidoreductase subunit C